MEKTSIFNLPNVRPMGRYHYASAQAVGVLPLLWAGSGLELCFTGSELHLFVEADFNRTEPWMAVELNGASILRMPLNRGIQDVCLIRGMTPGVPKRVRIFKETQPVSDDLSHCLRVHGLGWSDGEFLPPPEPAHRLEFVGDSLTSGEGVVGAVTETDWVPALFSASHSWAKLTADLLDADFRLISQSGWGVRSSWDNDPAHTIPSVYSRVCGPDSGISSQTMGTQYSYNFDSWQADAIIINLGTNDAGAMKNPPWHGPEGQIFQQTECEEGLKLFEDAAICFLRELRRCNPSAKLVWAYGMIDGPLSPVLENAVMRYRRETGERDAYYLSLPAVTDETIGSRQHPGPLCHQIAARTTAEFLQSIL